MSVRNLMSEFSEDVIRAFVQKNADYYITKWKLMAATDSKVSWNWPAFLFGGFWMLYRKMYLYFFILLFVSFIVGIIPFLSLILGLALWIGLGVFGNYLYAKFTYEKLMKLKLIHKDEESLKLAASQAGGTSVLAVAIALAIFIGLYILAIIAIIALGGATPTGYEEW